MRILMVCLGNICRSPLAEGILKTKNHNKHLIKLIESAGTTGYHTGKYADERSIEIAMQNNIDIRQHKARKFEQSDFKKYDIGPNLAHCEYACG